MYNTSHNFYDPFLGGKIFSCADPEIFGNFIMWISLIWNFRGCLDQPPLTPPLDSRMIFDLHYCSIHLKNKSVYFNSIRTNNKFILVHVCNTSSSVVIVCTGISMIEYILFCILSVTIYSLFHLSVRIPSRGFNVILNKR